MLFGWDPNKEEINIKKHGIDFTTASKVFDDEYLLEEYDNEHSLGEDRYKVLGMINDVSVVLAVIYTDRKKSCRIISARHATKKEERKYYANRERY